MTAIVRQGFSLGVIKTEDILETTLDQIPSARFSKDSASASVLSQASLDSKDPENFLKRCSGYNKKTKVRCSQVLGRSSQNNKKLHLTHLPTCKTHSDQTSFAGWCRHEHADGERCGRLFRWAPPHFELCEEHRDHPDMPCHFLKLPLELRHEIFRYLLPTESITSSILPSHQPTSLSRAVMMTNASFINSGLPAGGLLPPASSSQSRRIHPTSREECHSLCRHSSAHKGDHLFPFPFVDLLLINKEISAEAKDLLFRTATFTIDIRRDGTFMCGRRLLEPRRADGSAHFNVGDAAEVAERFISSFNFKAVKNYNVNILVENFNSQGNHSWDEEVELYDIRDYIGVTVSGILGKATRLHRLNVRIGLSRFRWRDDELIANIMSLAAPFERLRNVRQPKLCGVYDGFSQQNFMVNVTPTSKISLCSVPSLREDTTILGPGNFHFDVLKDSWEERLSQIAPTSLCRKPPIRAMFTAFKEFYSLLSIDVPEVSHRIGRNAFLHRARVARENEDVEAFRDLRNELIQYWYVYLEQQEARKRAVERQLSAMLDSDIYAPSIGEDSAPRITHTTSHSPTTLNAEQMAVEGIPMQGNQVTVTHPYQYHRHAQMFRRCTPQQLAQMQAIPARDYAKHELTRQTA